MRASQSLFMINLSIPGTVMSLPWSLSWKVFLQLILVGWLCHQGIVLHSLYYCTSNTSAIKYFEFETYVYGFTWHREICGENIVKRYLRQILLYFLFMTGTYHTNSTYRLDGCRVPLAVHVPPVVPLMGTTVFSNLPKDFTVVLVQRENGGRGLLKTMWPELGLRPSESNKSVC